MSSNLPGTDLPARNTTPWYTPFVAAWNALRGFVKGHEDLVTTGRLSTASLAATTSTAIAKATQKILPYPMDGTWPVFTRINGGTPVFTQAAQNPATSALVPTTSESIYWPWIIDARKILGASALDEFYMYYSTDHASHANSGIWFATAPTELGPWTGRGRVYRDDAGGAQTETPTVFPDPAVAGGLIMLYQQQGVPGAIGVQSTCYATSTDGITWTRGGLAIDIPTVWPGDGHTGYARHSAIGARHFAHGGAGGGDFPTFALSESVDGRKWRMQPDPLLYNMDLTGDGRRIEWNTTDIVMWQGKLWWVGFTSDFVSGSTPKNARLAVAPISDDLRTLLAPPKYVLYPTQGAETTNYRSNRAFIARDGRIIFYYQSGNSFYAASTEV